MIQIKEATEHDFDWWRNTGPAHSIFITVFDYPRMTRAAIFAAQSHLQGQFTSGDCLFNRPLWPEPYGILMKEVPEDQIFVIRLRRRGLLPFEGSFCLHRHENYLAYHCPMTIDRAYRMDLKERFDTI